MTMSRMTRPAPGEPAGKAPPADGGGPTLSGAGGSKRRVSAFREHSVLPGFGLSMGVTLVWLSGLVLLPVGALLLRAMELSVSDLWALGVQDPRVLAAYRLSLLASLAAATLNAVFGFILAWVLVRYEFPGRRVVDALVDLPFALPTAVSGIALTTLYARNGWLGAPLDQLGVRVAYTWVGIVIALTLIGLPFVVRTLQPAIAELDVESEEAASSLGATRLQTFCRVLFPTLLPSLLTGFALAFARALGEYGSVIFIAGNMPGRTEIAPLLVVIRLEDHNVDGAVAIGFVLLVAAFVMLFAINVLQAWSRRYQGT